MFEDLGAARVFALPPGVDFPRELIRGLRGRLKGQPPDAMARVELIVNTRRMARRVRDLFDAGPACLLPKVTLLSEIPQRVELFDLPPAVPALRRRLELSQLIRRLLENQPDLAPRTSLYDLADSLAELMSEMHGEGVTAQTIQALDVSDQSGHWERAQSFIAIADRFIGADAAPDPEARQRQAVERLARIWSEKPPIHPVVLAGSTGSRGTTALLMESIAALPQGAVVLPGFDFDLPHEIWDHLENALSGEDHPQYRFASLMARLRLKPEAIVPWTEASSPNPLRNRVVSLSLRPAPVTDAWLAEGPALPNLTDAMREITLLEASGPRLEALAIALRLRQAIEDGQVAALITPDRMLTRQVTAALDRWDVVPDDSAGQPLQLSPPGRLLRHVADLFSNSLTAESLLTILKHPLTHSGSDRGEHLRQTRDLELHLRKNGPPFPEAASLATFARTSDGSAQWVAWVAASLVGQHDPESRPLSHWVAQLRQLAERIGAGSRAEGSGGLWDLNAGQEAQNLLSALEQEAGSGGDMNARDFAGLLGNLLAAGQVRDRDAPREDIMIWGTLEARVQGADLLILGGLNEGSWPEPARADPWLNRVLRHQAGLLLPERRIGLAAHDFQQAAAAPEVWMTRALRTDEAETVASRWVNRLTNLLGGLPQRQGLKALEEMRARGNVWLSWADTLDDAPRVPAAPRPSPRPPTGVRPRRLSVTEIKRLIRDPYAVYARRVLGLQLLNPMQQIPDALLRGVVVHRILELFVKGGDLTQMPDPRAALLGLADKTLKELVAWPSARVLWAARLERIADWFLEGEAQRQRIGQPLSFEVRGQRTIKEIGFDLTAIADRIDEGSHGELRLYDYKTGAPPSGRQQVLFDKQLLLEAAIAEAGGFEGVPASAVRTAEFIGLGNTPKLVEAPLAEMPVDVVWAELTELITAYLSPSQGFTSRRALFSDSESGVYDHLARFGEWDHSTLPQPEDLT